MNQVSIDNLGDLYQGTLTAYLNEWKKMVDVIEIMEEGRCRWYEIWGGQG